MASNSEALAVALAHHQAGRLQAAEQIYKHILAADSNHADAWHLLGVAQFQGGNHRPALDFIRTAIRLNGNAAAFHCNLGNVLLSLEQRDEAVTCYRRALELKPDYAEALNNLGIAFEQQGKREEAVASFRTALELMPGNAEAHNRLGNLLLNWGRREEAIVCYRRALELRPSYAEAHNYLGSALQGLGRRDEAAACYRRALELKPNYAEAHYNLGSALQELERTAEAAGCYRRALELNPEISEAHNNLGNILRREGQWREAINCYRHALNAAPSSAETHNNLGNAFKDQELWDDAAACYVQALKLNPEYAEAHFNLGNIYRRQGKQDDAVACYRAAAGLKPDGPAFLGALVHELQHLCEWSDLDDLSRRLIELVDNGCQTTAPVTPFSFLALPVVTTARQQLRCAEQWVQRDLPSPAELGRNQETKRPAQQKSKLTIGYLSGDFHAHAVAVLIAQLFEKHDRDRFAVLGYSYGRDDGSLIRRRLAGGFDRFVDLKACSFRESALRIAADEVDILIDLKGYTDNARTEILALRPAPIEVNYLGYPGTMGASFIDYILVDDFIVPPDQQPFYTEKLVHLPGCYQVNDSRREIARRTPTRAECGLPDEGFVFCCFNNNFKITPQVFGVWMRLLEAVAGSVLWLFEGNRLAAGNLRREAEARGIAGNRLVFAPRLPGADHLARYRLADLFLDTVPYNAHTTASEALWVGCPVLTIAGETFASRVAGSLLRTLGLGELVATSLDEYAALALRLAKDRDQLAQLRARVQSSPARSSLFDAGRFVGPLEEAYATMWQIHAGGRQPQSFRVGAS